MVPWSGRSGRQEAKPKPLICIECGAVGAGHGEGFKAYLADDGEVVVYCASCAEREFGDDQG